MLISQISHLTSTRCPLYETLLNQKRLINLLNRTRILTHRRCNRSQPHRTTLELINHRQQNLIINLIQPITVDIQRLKRITRNRAVNPTRTLHLRKVTHTTQQSIRNTRRTPTPTRYLYSRLSHNRHLHYRRRTIDDIHQHLIIVVFKVAINTKSRTQRSRQQSATRSRSNQRKRLQFNLHRPCRWSLIYHNINPIILHRRIQILLHHRTQPMNLIYKQHIIPLQRRQQTCQIARLIKHRTRRQLKPYTQLIGYNITQRSLTKSRRPMQQSMVQTLTTHTRRLNKDAEVLNHLVLSCKIVKRQRTQRLIQITLSLSLRIMYIKITHNQLTIKNSSLLIPHFSQFLPCIRGGVQRTEGSKFLIPHSSFLIERNILSIPPYFATSSSFVPCSTTQPLLITITSSHTCSTSCII